MACQDRSRLVQIYNRGRITESPRSTESLHSGAQVVGVFDQMYTAAALPHVQACGSNGVGHDADHHLVLLLIEGFQYIIALFRFFARSRAS